ncbi:MAG: GntR family transcriptional regulator [Lachnospiraceae bacterium]|nr:GntR family transcriptional regulator [Lachnospiraceae bacterium]
MIVRIDYNSDEAFYVQLKNQIIMGIATAEIREGESLPSVRDLAELIGINMHTVNKAYSILRQEGYLKLDRRKGAVVSLNADRMRAIEEIRFQMKSVVAKALCRDLGAQDIHKILDDVLEEFYGVRSVEH